jgi:hypothetical protein
VQLGARRRSQVLCLTTGFRSLWCICGGKIQSTPLGWWDRGWEGRVASLRQVRSESASGADRRPCSGSGLAQGAPAFRAPPTWAGGHAGPRLEGPAYARLRPSLNRRAGSHVFDGTTCRSKSAGCCGRPMPPLLARAR